MSTQEPKLKKKRAFPEAEKIHVFYKERGQAQSPIQDIMADWNLESYQYQSASRMIKEKLPNAGLATVGKDDHKLIAILA
jgi:hypothetical protein